jgi:molybdate transport system ATP-binding protein
MISCTIRHRFPGLALNIGFEAPSPGTTVLFGPSGAGKSSVVAAMAGLLRADTARIEVDGVTLADSQAGVFLPPERRRLGMVFQDSRLFPHLDVARNLRYGLRRAPAGDIRFDDIVALLGLAALLDRRPHSLSGGERQRVAIGRALLSQPRLLLMDEPLSSLDAARKAEILPFLARLKTALSLPIVYVTHSMEELARLADHVVLIEAGQVHAAGPLATLSARGDLPLALRDDAGAVLTMRIATQDPVRRLTWLEGDGCGLWVPLLPDETGEDIRVRVPAREVILASEAPAAISLQNILSGRVHAVTENMAQHVALVEVTVGIARLLARVTPDAVARLRLVPGATVLVLIKASSIDILHAKDSAG